MKKLYVCLSVLFSCFALASDNDAACFAALIGLIPCPIIVAVQAGLKDKNKLIC